MRSYRENPDGEENTRATEQHERELFALKSLKRNLITARAVVAKSIPHLGMVRTSLMRSLRAVLTTKTDK